MKTTTNPSQRIGFTLIEMLVVIAIIAILAGFLFPAIGKSLRTAKRNTAAAEAKSIAGAIHMFYEEYGYFPVPETMEQGVADGIEQSSQDPTVADADFSKEVIKILMGGDTKMNPKGKVYLDSDTPIVNGEYLDPWGNQYCMKFDLDFNGKIQFFSGTKMYNKSVIVYSKGRDGEMNPHEDNVANVLVDFTLN